MNEKKVIAKLYWAQFEFNVELQNGNPLNLIYDGCQCSVCGYKVHWATSENYPSDIDLSYVHQLISEELSQQINDGLCPDHPKPQWVINTDGLLEI